MSTETSQLLEAFDALPAKEKEIFTVEFLRRAVPFDSGPLEDDETVAAADDLMLSIELENPYDDSPAR